MNPYAITPFICAIIALLLGTLVFLRNFRSPINRSFALLSFETFWWQIWWFGIYFAQTAPQKDLIVRIGYSLILFLPFTYYHFVVRFLNLKKELVWIQRSYLIGIFWLILLWITNLFIAGHNQFRWGSYGKAGSIHPVYLAFVTLVIIRTLALLKRSTIDPSRSAIARNQNRFVFLSACLYCVAATEYLINYGIGFYPIGVFFILGSFFVITYAIIKHHLMDIKLARQYLAMNLFYGAVASAIFIVLAFFLRQWFWGISVVIFLAILLGPYFHRRMTKFLEPAFLGETHRTWEELRGFWEKERVVFTSGQLADVVSQLPKIIGLESFSFFLVDRDRENLFVPQAFQGLEGVFDPQQAQFLNTIYADDPLVEYLKKQRRMVMRDELDPIKDKDIVAQMDEIRAFVSIPLFVAGKLTAILNLGRKKSGEMFHEQDIELLKEVTKGAEEHLAHIAFFDNSLLFSGSVAHDITKPFRRGIIYSYLDEISRGLENPQDKQAAKGALNDLGHCLENLHNMSERMVEGFKDLEAFLRTGFRPQRIDYLQKVNEESKSHKMLAEEKGLSLEIVVPKRALFLYADSLSVGRILNELLTNAIKYTDRGKITVKISQENPQEILTEISDTGCGLPEEKLDDIWELFKRKDDDKKTEGTGIGLAMVRQLVEANGGKIWVNSKEGEGSSFFFAFPAYKPKRGGR